MSKLKLSESEKSEAFSFIVNQLGSGKSETIKLKPGAVKLLEFIDLWIPATIEIKDGDKEYTVILESEE